MNTAITLAAAVRKSERTALAMDAKAFGALPQRTYYRQMVIRRGDVLFLLAWLLYVAVVYALALHFGLAHLQWVPRG
jgi:energy-coupling factor transport system permease protein